MVSMIITLDEVKDDETIREAILMQIKSLMEKSVSGVSISCQGFQKRRLRISIVDVEALSGYL